MESPLSHSCMHPDHERFEAPLTPALSPCEGERENVRQSRCKGWRVGRFMDRGKSQHALGLTPRMKSNPLRTSVIGSYPFPGWLEFSCQHLDQFGESDRAELQDDVVTVALHDQLAAGLDVITDGEQT